MALSIRPRCVSARSHLRWWLDSGRMRSLIDGVGIKLLTRLRHHQSSPQSQNPKARCRARVPRPEGTAASKACSFSLYSQAQKTCDYYDRSSTNVSLYRIAHCNLLRSELVCLIQTGPLSDHAIIQSAAVCTKSLARGPVRAIDPRTTLKNCSHCRINLRRFGAYPRTVPRLQFADLGPRERPLGLSLWMWDHLPRRVSFSPPTAFCTLPLN